MRQVCRVSKARLDQPSVCQDSRGTRQLTLVIITRLYERYVIAIVYLQHTALGALQYMNHCQGLCQGLLSKWTSRHGS